MRLEKIEINGFKSFADKTEIILDGSVTGVVGPNGSGKSNIADAVRWVLGEQNSRSLRGSKMEDVIFGGTQNRRRKAFCEVALYFDNADMQMPSPYTEIVISRKLFRSGESEYAINGTSVRLKDVLELIRDTGIGKEGYSIVEQGRVDDLLSAKPQARRKVFEEAAGVMKYRTRKEEAERKLERTQDNLMRIDDILEELGTQIEPLREQAEKTKEYLALFDRQKVLDANIFLINQERVDKRLSKLQADLRTVERELIQEEKSFGSKQKNIAEMNERIAHMEEALGELRASATNARAEAEQASGKKDVLFERIQATERDLLRLQTEIDEAEQGRESLISEQDAAEENRAVLQSSIAELEEEITNLEEEKRKTEEAQNTRLREMEANRRAHLAKLEESGAFERSYATLGERQEQILGRIAQTEERARETEMQLLEAQTEYDALKDRLTTLQKTGSQKVAELETANAALQTVQTSGEEAARALEQATAALRDAENRSQFLNNLKQEYEGYAYGVRNLMRGLEAHSELEAGIYGAVAELITVPKEYERAVESVLGGALQNVVVKTDAVAKQAVQFLRDKKLGRVSFMPLNALNVRHLNNNELASLGKECIIRADQAVFFDAEIAPAVEYLLARTVIVRDMDDAVTLARRSGYKYRIVTLEGDVVNPGGIITGGSNQKRNFGLLSRGRDIEIAQKAAADARVTIAKLETKREELLRLYSMEKEHVDALLSQIKEMDIGSAELRANAAAGEQRLTALKEEQIRLAKLTEQLVQEREEISRSLVSTERQLAAAKDEAERLAALIEALPEQAEEVSSLLERRLTEKLVAKTEAQGQLSALKRDLERIVLTFADMDGAREAKELEIRMLELQKEALVEERERAIAMSVKMQEREAELQEEVAVKEETRKELSAQVAEIQRQNAEFQLRQTALLDEKYKLENQAERLKMSMETAGTKLWDDYGMTFGDAEKLKTEINYTACANELQEIRERIRSLGIINPNAVEDYERVYDRHSELTTQKADLEQAKGDLEQVIVSVVDAMRTVFAKKFVEINGAFGKVFRTLFGGGRANLYLDGDDVMECGIEIDVEPPGKKLQNISLLSGGERALTGIALLFAMIHINPSPICIVDEIDAPLDEANVVRFCKYLKTMEDMQFLIITHRKPTMTICDTLFGVAMEEKGVSKMVSVKMSETA